MIELGTKLLIVIIVVNAIVNVVELILDYNKNWLDYDLETSKLAVKNKELDLEKRKAYTKSLNEFTQKQNKIN